MTKGLFNLETRKFSTGLDALAKALDKAIEKQKEAEKAMRQVRSLITENDLTSVRLQNAAMNYRDSIEEYKTNQIELEKRLVRGRERKLEKRIKELEVIEAEYNKIKNNEVAIVSRGEQLQVAKATTLSIYDSIIFAISNWSTDGQTAGDIELACQATLFPCIYQKVMEGVEDYFFDEVPTSALLVVQRGREYVRSLRETEDRFITEPDIWLEYAPTIHEWWINDGLPLLYGARDDDWELISPKTLEEMIVWRDQPASRALDFPLIWDGMELIKKYPDEIRESGLPAFNKQQLTTRLEP